MAACGGVKEPPTGLGAGGVFFVMYVVFPSPLSYREILAKLKSQFSHLSRRLPPRRHRLPTHRPAPARLAPAAKLQRLGLHLLHRQRRHHHPHLFLQQTATEKARVQSTASEWTGQRVKGG